MPNFNDDQPYERLIVQPEAQDHINAFLEYKMITGYKAGDELMPPEQYEKLREEWHGNKRARFIEYETPKRDEMVRRVAGRGEKRRNTRPKFVPQKDAPSPLDLLRRKVAFGRDSGRGGRALRDESSGSVSGSRRMLTHLDMAGEFDEEEEELEGRVVSGGHASKPAVRRTPSGSNLSSGGVRSTSGTGIPRRTTTTTSSTRQRAREPTQSSQPKPKPRSSSQKLTLTEIRDLPAHKQIDMLEDMLADKSMSSVQQYAVKKQLATAKGILRREEIKMRQQNQ